MPNSPVPLTPEGVLALIREFADEDAFLCDFAGVTSINAPNIDRVILLQGGPMGDKRVRADTCPVCDGTVLAPQSLRAHVRDAHPEAILPNGETINEAIERLAAARLSAKP
jgi:hypothetical protein